MFAFRVLHTVPYSNEPAAHDIIAKLHSFVTTNLLIACALIISFRQFGGKPIDCMVPPDFTSSWVQYAEMFCYAQESYFVPFTSVAAGLTEADKAEKKVSYYQWMPFFLLFEAACFKIPALIWKYFASQSGMKVGEILRLSTTDANGVPEVKRSNVEALGVHLNGALRFHKTLNKASKRRIVPHKVLRFLNVKYSMYYVTLIYFVAKIAFLLNVGLQVRLLESYVLPPSEDENIALRTWRVLVSGNETWKDNGIFPRVTLCDFETRDLGNVQTHTVQCLLLMNVFTEKIFLVLWTWYMVLSAFTALNLVSWCWCMLSETTQLHFILSHLEMSDVAIERDRKESTEKASRFTNLYLGSDGMLILLLVAQHSDVVFTAELVSHLWNSFVQVEQQRKDLKRMNDLLETRKKLPMSREPSPDGGFVLEGPIRLKRALSMEGVGEGKKFDDGSDEEVKGSSKRSSRKGNPSPRPSLMS